MSIQEQIHALKQKRNAVILAHNYQLDEVQTVADYIGDSFYLSKVAAQTSAEVIVFAGVYFMAETAKLLAPHKTVLLPESDAGCPLADTITAADVRALKQQYPGVPVVCYVNSSAAVKAESDVCCTSANAVRVVAGLPAKRVIFIPDGHLGDYVAKALPEKELILWPGSCVTHAKVQVTDVSQARAQHPTAQLLVHPECAPDVVALADFVGSTSEIIRHASEAAAQTYLIGTEAGVLCTLRHNMPEKEFYLLHKGLFCPNMKKTRVQSIHDALYHNQYDIQVADVDCDKAVATLHAMLELA